jgi:hypothetical protein
MRWAAALKSSSAYSLAIDEATAADKAREKEANDERRSRVLTVAWHAGGVLATVQ